MITHFEKCVDLCNLTPKGSNLRCSRPLCSSQSTGGTPYDQRPLEVRLLTEKGPEEKSNQVALVVPVPQDPTACIYIPSTTKPVQPQAAYWIQSFCFCINVNVPPMSAIEEHSSSYDLAVVFRCIQTALLCSLERR